jgi:hypothetical protein
MPTMLPPAQPERDPRGPQNLAATAAVLALITLCLWLFYALADASAKSDTSAPIPISNSIANMRRPV